LKFLVIGAGGQGAPCASILSRDPDVSEILLADIDKELLEKVSEKIGSGRVNTTPLDAGKLDELLKAAEGVDAIINLTLPRFNMNIMEAALRSGAHYVDSATDPVTWDQIVEKKPLEFDEGFREAGLTAVIGCGGTPGITNVLARYACDKLDSVNRISIILGGRSLKETEDVIEAWDPGWCPEVALMDYASEAIVFEDGEYDRVPPFGRVEEYRFPDPVGPLLVYPHIHEEAITLPRFIGKGVRHVDFRYPVDRVAGALVKLGFARDDPVEVRGVEVLPRDVLLKLVRRPVNSFLTEDERTLAAPLEYAYCTVIEVEGEKGGAKQMYTLTFGSNQMSTDDRLEMFRRLGTTSVFVAAPATVAAKMCIEGEAESGVIAPECLDPIKFLRKMAETGVPIGFHETLSRTVSIS